MLRIIYLEDTLDDVDLLRSRLRRELPGSEIHHVDQRGSFLEALSAFRPDLILSDFTLAGFSGLEALNLARQSSPDTPFIFVSGTIGEDRAIEALKAGASDYVIKDRPKRLVPAIKRALADAQQQRERRAAELQLLRSQRLENIGLLAAGIAHDFNNILTPILMAAPALRERTADAGDQSMLATIEQSAERGASLVRQILGFAHGAGGGLQDIRIEPVVEDLLGVLRPTFPKGITIQSDLAPDLWPVQANTTQVHQVLLNLCVNARDAMPKGGTLSIRARNASVDEVAAETIKHGRPGSFVHLEIQDTGTGIPPEILDRIWEPFFTTKGEGQGTGLGLSTVRGIVETHRGFLNVETAPGSGTRFHVYLPAAESAPVASAPRQPRRAKAGAGELILVVDDEPHVRDVTSAILTRNGYRVLTAQDGTDALALLAPRSTEVRLVITDINMPNMDGIALAKVIRCLNPSLPILTVTGLADDPQRREARTYSAALLLKPFSSDKLLSALEQVLHPGVPVTNSTR